MDDITDMAITPQFRLEVKLTGIDRTNPETWARRTIEEAPISESEFSENLPRIGGLARTYGLDPLREIIVTMTSAGVPFLRVLVLLERGDVPPNMRD